MVSILYKIFDTFFKTIFFTSFVVGLWICLSPLILSPVKTYISKSRFKRDAKIASENIRESRIKLIRYLDRILEVTLRRYKINISAYTFLVISISIFLISFWMLYETTISFSYVLLLSLMLATTPYILLLVLLRNRRTESSHEGEFLVTEIINQYKRNDLNMGEAIAKAASNIVNLPYSHDALFTLSFKIRDSRNIEEIKESINTFVYSFDTEWAIQLGMNMEIALIEGTIVVNSLDDILGDLQEIRENTEKQKRDNNESFTIIRFILIPAYLLSAYISIKMFDFTLTKFLTYQFRTNIGIKFASVMFSSIIVCMIILLINKKPKYDI